MVYGSFGNLIDKVGSIEIALPNPKSKTRFSYPVRWTPADTHLVELRLYFVFFDSKSTYMRFFYSKSTYMNQLKSIDLLI